MDSAYKDHLLIEYVPLSVTDYVQISLNMCNHFHPALFVALE